MDGLIGRLAMGTQRGVGAGWQGGRAGGRAEVIALACLLALLVCFYTLS